MTGQTASPAEIALREELMSAVIRCAQQGMGPQALLHSLSATLAGTMAMFHLTKDQATQSSLEVATYAVETMVSYQAKNRAKMS